MSRSPWLLGLACLALLGCHPGYARRFAAPCAAGQVRVCLGRCATPAAGGEACTPSPDECAAGFRPCPDGLTCQASPGVPATGRCVTPPSLFCDPARPAGSAENLCPAGDFCATLGPPGTACYPPLRPGMAATVHGICARGRLDGERCDGDRASASRPPIGRGVCTACAPGLVCWNQTCRRPCRPEDGGLGNCVPDEQTAHASTSWACSEQTGRLWPGERAATEPLCTVCTPHRNPCDLPPDAVAQTLAGNPLFLCCDPEDRCVHPVELHFLGGMTELQAQCCRPPTAQGFDGGRCTADTDCCPLFLDGQRLSHCCTSADQQGCRPSNVGRCAGCGPGTHVPCCEPGSCGDHRVCAGSNDAVQCLGCGIAGAACCEGGTCDGGLGCFDRPDFRPTGRRCEACGGGGQQCCPGSQCSAGNACLGGTCRPCGGRDQACCANRGCDSRLAHCDGADPGICRQECGAIGLRCCDLGVWGGPPRPYCEDDSSICDASFQCRHCGASGEPACSSGSGCAPGLGIANGTCGPCGRDGQACCVPGSPASCFGGLACDPAANRCAPCGGVNQLCCPTGPACIAGQGTACSGGRCILPPG